MEKFSVKKKNILGEIYTDTVLGLPVNVPEFPEVNFFIYQHDGSFGLGDNDSKLISGDKCVGKYIISECSTGMFIMKPFDNPEEAAFALSERCKKLTPQRKQELLESIEQNKVNLSPQ